MANSSDSYFKNREYTNKKFPLHIFVNQVGYLPHSEKRAVITLPAEDFSVIDEQGNICFEGKAVHFGIDECSGDDVYIADFSSLTLSGKYRVRAAGETSLEFCVGENVLDRTLNAVTKAYYFLRCGCPLEEKYAGKFTHGKCHGERAVLWEDNSVSLDICGGWHDAGDYGRYVTAAACAVAHLLYAYKMFPEKLKGLSLNIPESGALPDILGEVKYELEWLLKMQREDGAVYHKATTQHHAAFVMPENDVNQMYVLPVSTMATADFAAVCALASTVYRDEDREFSERLLAAAANTCRWLEDNPEFIGFENPDGCHTGTYGEWTDKDNRFWAWAEMFAATGNEHYHENMKKALKEEFPLTALGYGSVGGFGALSYLLCGRNCCDKALTEKFTQAFRADAERLAHISDKCGYGAAMDERSYCWGSNMNLMKRGMVFAIADYLAHSDKYRTYAQRQADYLLGVNATGYSYVTGIGDFCCNYPHLRPAYADGIEKCIPGMVSGGPNGRPCDPDAIALVPKGTPPMKCFADDVGCYSLNEITIYWNSPTVFVLAYIS